MLMLNNNNNLLTFKGKGLFDRKLFFFFFWGEGGDFECAMCLAKVDKSELSGGIIIGVGIISTPFSSRNSR